MPFLNNFPNTPYKFGNEDFTVDFPDLTVYSDIIDSVKLNGSFYDKYYIQQGERPDTLSQKIYGTDKWHWTFYLLNDHLREMGWPLDRAKLQDKLDDDFPNTILVTYEDIFDNFKPGTTVTAAKSNATGKIIRRNVDLGYIWVEGKHEFQDDETIDAFEDGIDKTVIIHKAYSEEKTAPMFYTDANGNPADIDPRVGPGELLTATTYERYYIDLNEENRSIKIMSKEVAAQVVEEMKKVLI